MRRRLVAALLAACAPLAAAEALPPNEGIVLEVDKPGREISIRHGPLPELGMDPMSMVFNVADPALLQQVKKGDRVRFKAGLVNGRFAVVSIQRIAAAKTTERERLRR